MKILKLLKKYTTAESINSFLQKNKIWLPVFLLTSALLSAHNQYDFFWDLINYHYYNAWAFWEDISSYNIVTLPGQMNTLLNPLLDVPLYLLVKYFNDSAAVIYGIQGLWYGLLLFLFWKTAQLFFDSRTYLSAFCIVAATIIAATGQNTWFQAGSSTNEVQISVFTMTGLYFTLKYLKEQTLQTGCKFLGLGVLLGAALAVKPTCVSYIIAGGISLMISFRRLRHPLQYIGLYTLGGLLGYLLFNGYFMWEHYVQYGNPFLPAFNEMFSTDWFGMRSLIDLRYIPHKWEFLYYPYLFETRSAEIQYYDKRGWIYYTAFIGFILYACVQRKKLKFFQNPLNTYITCYLLISYILWIRLFGIARYTITLEMISALLFTKICAAVRFKKDITQALWLSVLIVTGYILASTPHQSIKWPRLKKEADKRFVYLEPTTIPSDMLLAFYNRPSAIIIPLLAQYNKSFAVINYRHFYELEYNPPLKTKIMTARETTKQQYGEDKTIVIYLKEQDITTNSDKEIYDNRDVTLGFEELEKKMDCYPLVSNMVIEYRICYPRPQTPRTSKDSI